MVERERKRIGLVHFSKLKPIERENAVAYVRADIDTVVAVKPSLSKRFKYYFIPLISLHHPNLLRLRNLVKSECPDCRVTNSEKVTNSSTCISMERLSRMRAALRPTRTRRPSLRNRSVRRSSGLKKKKPVELNWKTFREILTSGESLRNDASPTLEDLVITT